MLIYFTETQLERRMETLRAYHLHAYLQAYLKCILMYGSYGTCVSTYLHSFARTT